MPHDAPERGGRQKDRRGLRAQPEGAFHERRKRQQHDDNDDGPLKSYLTWTADETPAGGQVILEYTTPLNNRPELFASATIEHKPDVADLTFRVCRYAAADEAVLADLTLNSDDKTVAETSVEIPLDAGVNNRRITWTVPALPDGAYEGILTLTPPEGGAVVCRFSYVRMMSSLPRQRLAVVRQRLSALEASGSTLY